MRTIAARKALTTTGPLVLVNSTHPLVQQTQPELVPADPRWPEILLERRAARLLSACIQAVGGADGIVPVSGWRSRAQQQAIWDDTLKTEGEAFTRSYVALPGCSEHESGLAIDLGLAADEIDFIRPEFPEDGVCGDFRRAAAGYGFILRYPAGKERLTGIAHEPWHFRYVGIPHAQIMAERGLVLEEYLDLLRDHPWDSPLRFQSGVYEFRIFRLEADDGLCELPRWSGYRQISGDNCGGLIVTQWR